MAKLREYSYVGPAKILEASKSMPPGSVIKSKDELTVWIEENASDAEINGSIVATFVISSEGNLCLAPRRSEHVACASAQRVLSAGEMTFTSKAEVSEVSNQSTGYCPEPESWPAVAAALNRIGVSHPEVFTTAIVFRLCPNCRERSIIKDHWYVCDLCGSDLPKEWNFLAE